MDPETFERKRLELFERNGFKGRPRRIHDRLGREVCLIERAGRGPPTVLVHGGLSEASMWALLAGRLPGRIIIPDRPGFGLSYQIDYSGVDFRQAAIDWLLDLLNGLDADEADLVGNSIGGFFATVFALAHPQRVRRLVLIGRDTGVASVYASVSAIVGQSYNRSAHLQDANLRSRGLSRGCSAPFWLPSPRRCQVPCWSWQSQQPHCPASPGHPIRCCAPFPRSAGGADTSC